MPKKLVNRAKAQFKDKDDQYVIDTYRASDGAISSDCFGAKDGIFLALATVELYRRGYTISEDSNVTIEKRG